MWTVIIEILIKLQFVPLHKLLICTTIISHRFRCGDNTLDKCADGTPRPPFRLQLFTYMYVCVARPLYARTRETRGAAFTPTQLFPHSLHNGHVRVRSIYHKLKRELEKRQCSRVRHRHIRPRSRALTSQPATTNGTSAHDRGLDEITGSFPGVRCGQRKIRV